MAADNLPGSSTDEAADAAPEGCARDDAGAERRALFVTYVFPPVGGAGVQRTAKFLKYLPECGWRSSVLTAANPSVPVTDATLLADVPADVLVRRARTWEPGYAVKSTLSGRSDADRPPRGLGRFLKDQARAGAKVLLQPDPQILFVPDALRQGRRLLRDVRHDVIVATAPPFSVFLIGRSLSRRFGIPLVLDYRDEWGVTNVYSENRRVPAPCLRLQKWMQYRVLRAADAVVATSRRSAQAVSEVRDAAGGTAPVHTIYNGFDPDDFGPAGPAAADPSRYRLAYVGTLWNLTSAEPLVNAVRRLSAEHPALAAQLELVFAGRRTPEQEAVLTPLRNLPCRVVERPYVTHPEAIELMREADGLCVLLSDVPEAGRVIPAKLFEYMAAWRTIFAISPPGELWDLLSGHPSAYRCPPSEDRAIAEALRREIARKAAGLPAPSDWDPAAFSRRSQARQLADILEQVSAGGTRTASPADPDGAAPPTSAEVSRAL